jgi:hypothetical protein
MRASDSQTGHDDGRCQENALSHDRMMNEMISA